MSRTAQLTRMASYGYALDKQTGTTKFRGGAFGRSDFPIVSGTIERSDDNIAVRVVYGIVAIAAYATYAALKSRESVVDPKPKSSGRETHEFAVISDLKRMENGWAGPNTVAPNSKIIESVYQLIVAFGWKKENVPDFLIDPDNGTILIMWDLDEDRVCAIDIYLDGGIKCAVTSVSVGSSVSRTFNSSNCGQLLEFVNSDICFDGD